METVRGQAQPFAEILCYDDGSTDETVAVARSLGLKIITGHSNAGVSIARNRLADAAGMEWIHFHDADDVMLPGFLARLGPACDGMHDVVTCDADWVDESSGALLIAWRYDPTELAHAPIRHLLKHSMSFNNSIIRRSCWKSVGGCDESLAMWEDADLHFRLSCAGARFFHVPEVHTRSLRHSDSFSHDYRRSWGYRVDALERYADSPNLEGFKKEIADEAERAASEFAVMDAKSEAERALRLCNRLGYSPPNTKSLGLRLLKLIFPVYPLLRMQARWRLRAYRKA